MWIEGWRFAPLYPTLCYLAWLHAIQIILRRLFLRSICITTLCFLFRSLKMFRMRIVTAENCYLVIWPDVMPPLKACLHESRVITPTAKFGNLKSNKWRCTFRKKISSFENKIKWGSEIWIFTIQILWRSDFKWLGFSYDYSYSSSHLKTLQFKIQIFLSRFQMDLNKMAAICQNFNWLGFRISYSVGVCVSNSRNQPYSILYNF